MQEFHLAFLRESCLENLKDDEIEWFVEFQSFFSSLGIRGTHCYLSLILTFNIKRYLCQACLLLTSEFFLRKIKAYRNLLIFENLSFSRKYKKSSFVIKDKILIGEKSLVINFDLLDFPDLSKEVFLFNYEPDLL